MSGPLRVVLALLLLASPAAGQRASAPDARELLGRHVRVRPLTGPLAEGVLTRFDLDTLAWREGDAVRAIPRAALDTLWTRGARWRGGALVGTLVGAVPVALVCADTLDECGLVPNGVGLIAGSAVVGALIGSALHRWTRVYP